MAQLSRYLRYLQCHSSATPVPLTLAWILTACWPPLIGHNCCKEPHFNEHLFGSSTLPPSHLQPSPTSLLQHDARQPISFVLAVWGRDSLDTLGPVHHLSHVPASCATHNKTSRLDGGPLSLGISILGSGQPEQRPLVSDALSHICPSSPMVPSFGMIPRGAYLLRYLHLSCARRACTAVWDLHLVKSGSRCNEACTSAQKDV